MSDGLCKERAGFLFKHACDNTALHRCERCGKDVCNQHVDMGEDGQQWCISCARTAGRQETVEETEQRSGRPHYYYGASWYAGYGYYHSGWGHHHYHSHYHDDFTEGDAEALGEYGDDEGFEQELDAS